MAFFRRIFCDNQSVNLIQSFPITTVTLLIAGVFLLCVWLLAG
jgi:hypothetical protein